MEDFITIAGSYFILLIAIIFIWIYWYWINIISAGTGGLITNNKTNELNNGNKR